MSSSRALPQPGSQEAPKYWMHETGGALAAAVYLFLGEPGKMTVGAIALLRAYFVQWIESPVWDMNPAIDKDGRRELANLRVGARYAINSVEDIRRWLAAAVAAGMDPL